MPRDFFENDTETYEFERVVAETDKAWLIDFGDGVEEWIPKSQSEIVDEHAIEIPDWLAREKGIG